MKFFKHIILSIIALGVFVLPANAQTDVKALTGALAETIREYSNYADSLAYRIAFANRKNPTVLLGIAEAYNMNQELTKTKKYAMEALAVQPDFAPSYVLLGKACQYKYDHYRDMEAYKDTAIMYFKKAMEVNPLYPDSYGYYADIMQKDDPEGVLKMYLQLRDQRPDLPINGTIGALQFAIAVKAEDDTTGVKKELFKRAIVTYEDQGNDRLTTPELQKFCDLLDFTASYTKDPSEKNFYREKLLSVASFGHEREATNPVFLSQMLAANYGLTRYDEAIKNANELFTSADTATLHYHFMPYDYRYHGLSMMSLDSLDAGVDRILEGIEVGNVMAYDDLVTFRERELAAAQRNEMVKDITSIVNVMMAQGKWDDAYHIREYQMNKKDSATINDWLFLTEILQKKYQAVTEQTEKDLTQRQLIEIFSRVEKDYPTDPQVCSIYYSHAYVMSQTEKNPKTGNALSLYTKLYNLESSNPSRDSSDDQYFAVAANYLAIYYFLNSDYENAMKYALTMQDFDMTYNAGEQIFNACAKAKPKTAARLRATHKI